MHGLVIKVGRYAVSNVESRWVGGLTEMLLLIEDIMLGAGNDAGALDTLNSGRDQLTGQVWIRRKSFL